LSEAIMGKSKNCPHCGAKMMEYRHVLNDALIAAFRRLCKHGQINLRKLKLGHSPWANFQKLRYFGLVEKCYDEHGRLIKGVWEVTPRGWRFFHRQVKLYCRVWSYRGEFRRFDKESPRVSILDFPGFNAKFKQKEEYADDAEPHDPDDPQT
jgi:hypothetical protein